MCAMPNIMHRTINAPTPQSEQASPDQVKNNAGGWVYDIGVREAFNRFLILGTEGGTYYMDERKLTKAGMALVKLAVAELSPSDFMFDVEHAAKVAPKRTYALWALSEALVSGTNEHKALAPRTAKMICFTGTDVFELVSYIDGRRGWSDAIKRVFTTILLETPVDKLALWSVKYRDRFGFTWRDLLRLTHPKTTDPERNAVFAFMAGKDSLHPFMPVQVGFLANAQGIDEETTLQLIDTFGLPWEALRDEQRTPLVWKAVTPNIGNQAVLRNLATFTRNGLTEDREYAKVVAGRIAGASNLHPIKVLDALRTYQSGGNIGRSRGGVYRPYTPWLTALEDSLDRSFTDGVNATGQRIYVGLDVSGSMGALAQGSFVLNCREVGAALALAFVKNEDNVEINGFCDGRGRQVGYHNFRDNVVMKHLPFSARTSFNDAITITSGLPFGGTDCALPMIDALERKVKVDTFIVITDNETWHGQIHPMEALRKYRVESGLNSRLVVIALTPTRFSIADPADRGTLDIAGFSSDLPVVIERFMAL